MKTKISLLALAFLFTPAFAFASIPVSGTLPGNTTWTTGNTYVVSGLIIPAGVTLTIPEGTVVKFSDIRTVLQVDGNLIVNGTETNPSYFTSINDSTIGESLGTGIPLHDDWGNIMINEGGTAEFNHSVIRYGGYTGWLTSTTPSSFRNHGGNLTISNSIISHSWAGLIHESGTTILTGNTFSENNAGISSGGTGSLTFNHNTFSNNIGNAASLDLSSGLVFTHSDNTVFGGTQAGIILGGTTASDCVFEKDAVPYIIDHLTIPAGKTVTVQQGSVFKFAGITSELFISGKLNIEGTASEPVYFTSIKDDSILGDTNGDASEPTTNEWEGIFVLTGGEANFDHSIVRYGGYTGWLQSDMASNISNSGGILNISNSEISHSTFGVHHFSGITSVATSTISENSTGIYAGGTGSLSVVGNTFSNNASPAFFDISGFVLTNANNTAIGTGSNGFDTGGTLAVDQTLGKDTMPYLFSGLSIPSGRTLTIAPGAVIKMASIRAQFFVAGTLNAIGTKEDPIYLTSINDNSVGGTTGTGDPQPADWAEMGISTGGVMNFNHAVIRYGGQNSWGIWTDLSNLANRGGTLDIQNSEIAYAHIGIVHTAGTTNISQSSIHDNTGYGINNTTTVVLNARNNYWGSLSGPTHASNPLGTGDRVSDYVDYTPYLMFDPTGSCSVDCYSNVMFLPGMEASRLYRPDYNGGTNRLWEPNSSNDAESLTLGDGFQLKDSDIYTQKNDVIDEAYIPLGLGPNIYKSFIESMNTLKNDDHLIADWSAVPYDWRLDYNDILTHGAEINGKIYYRGDLAATSTSYIIQELKRLASTSRTGKVTIIAHSNGGLLAKALTSFLGEEESSKLIDKIVMVAVPQLGTPQAIGAILNGYGQGIPNNLFYPLLSPQNARSMAQNMPVAYNLLPSEEYFHYVDDPVITISSSTLPTWALAYGTTTHSTIRLDNFMADVLNKRTKPTFGNVESPEIVDPAFLQQANSVHNILDYWTPPAGIQLITIAGWGEETLSSIGYKTVKACTDASCYFLGDKITETISHVIDGDGTVVEPSAHWANGANSTLYWVNLGKYNSDHPFITVLGRLPFNHSNIFEVPELRMLTKNIITRTNTGLEYISTVAPQYTGDTPRLHFTLHSPLTLEFYDTLGNHVGYSAVTNSIEQNIPGVQYERYGEVQWISIPKDIAGRLVMRGIDSGSFALGTEEVNGNNVLSSASFEGVPSSINTVVTMNVIPSQSVTNGAILSIDENGDSTADITLTAKSGEIVVPDSLSPHTTTTINGTLGTNDWYTSNVSVTFSAIDVGSGIKNTLYSTDKGISWNSVSPLAISTEGTTTIQYYSVDNAGNKEATSTLNIKIDKIAPEAKISVDATTKDLKIEGVDMNPITVTKDASNVYTITDLAGHTTKLFFQKTFLGKLLTFAKLTGVQYDTATKVTLPSSSFVYLWNPLVNPPVLLSQTIAVNGTYAIEAVYDKKKNQTTVLLKKKGVQIQKQIFTGLRIPKLTVEKGVVGYTI